MILTNCTDSPRGLMLSSGIKVLGPREMWRVPVSGQDEIRSLFRSRTLQRFVDNNIFRLGGMADDEESTVVPTPAPPSSLAAEVRADGLERPVGVATGSRAASPAIVDYQTIAPLEGAAPQEGGGAAVEKKAVRTRKKKA